MNLDKKNIVCEKNKWWRKIFKFRSMMSLEKFKKKIIFLSLLVKKSILSNILHFFFTEQKLFFFHSIE